MYISQISGYWIGNIQKRSGFGASSGSSGKAGIFCDEIRKENFGGFSNSASWGWINSVGLDRIYIERAEGL